MTQKILIIVVIFKQFIFLCIKKIYDSCKHHHNDFLTVQIIIVKKMKLFIHFLEQNLFKNYSN